MHLVSVKDWLGLQLVPPSEPCERWQFGVVGSNFFRMMMFLFWWGQKCATVDLLMDEHDVFQSGTSRDHQKAVIQQLGHVP